MTGKDLMKIAFILLLATLCFYINCLGEFPEDDFQAVIISDVHVSNDTLFDQIEIYETTSFGVQIIFRMRASKLYTMQFIENY